MAGGNTQKHRFGIKEFLLKNEINNIKYSKYNKKENYNFRILGYKLNDNVFNRSLILTECKPLIVINVNGREILILHLVLTQPGGVSKQLCYYWLLIEGILSKFSKCILFLEGYDEYAKNEYEATIKYFQKYGNVNIITSISNLTLGE